MKLDVLRHSFCFSFVSDLAYQATLTDGGKNFMAHRQYSNHGAPFAM